MAAARVRPDLSADSGNPPREGLGSSNPRAHRGVLRGIPFPGLFADAVARLAPLALVGLGGDVRGVWIGALLPGLERHDPSRTVGSAARLSRGAMGKSLSRHARALDD